VTSACQQRHSQLKCEASKIKNKVRVQHKEDVMAVSVEEVKPGANPYLGVNILLPPQGIEFLLGMPCSAVPVP
jgi:hypothetical protein